MTAKAKIAITLPQELLDTVRARVRDGRASSVSAYIAEAVDQYSRPDSLEALLDEALQRTGGPMTDVERAEIDRLVGWDEA